MKAILIQSAAAALLAAALLPSTALSQGTTRAVPGFGPGTVAGAQVVCTPLERNVGLSGEECGKLTLSELAQIKADKENTN